MAALLMVGFHQSDRSAQGPATGDWRISAAQQRRNPVLYDRYTARPVPDAADMISKATTNCIPICSLQHPLAVQLWSVRYVLLQAMAVSMPAAAYVYRLRLAVLKLPSAMLRAESLLALHDLDLLLAHWGRSNYNCSQKQVQHYVTELDQKMVLAPEMLAQMSLPCEFRFNIMLIAAYRIFVRSMTDSTSRMPRVLHVQPDGVPKWNYARFETLFLDSLDAALVCLTVQSALNRRFYSALELHETILDRKRGPCDILLAFHAKEQVFPATFIPPDLQTLVFQYYAGPSELQQWYAELLCFGARSAMANADLDRAFKQWKPLAKIPMPLLARIPTAEDDKDSFLGEQFARAAGHLLRKIRRCKVRLKQERPLQNVRTNICTTCGDAYPLPLAGRLFGVTESQCAGCIQSKQEKRCPVCCDYAAKFENKRCPSCSSARQNVGRVYVSQKHEHRWHAHVCTTCASAVPFVYYTQRALPPQTKARCSYCRANVRNPLLGTAETDTPRGALLKLTLVRLQKEAAANDYTEERLLKAKECHIPSKEPLFCVLCEAELKVGAADCFLQVCKDCLSATVGPAFWELETRIAAEAQALPLLPVEEHPVLMHHEAVRPWMTTKGIELVSLLFFILLMLPCMQSSCYYFKDVCPWTAEMLTKGKEQAILQCYERVQKYIDPRNKKYAFVARDQPPCPLCKAVCEHNWYGASLCIKTVTCDGKKDKLIIVVFPGWTVQHPGDFVPRRTYTNIPVQSSMCTKMVYIVCGWKIRLYLQLRSTCASFSGLSSRFWQTTSAF